MPLLPSTWRPISSFCLLRSLCRAFRQLLITSFRSSGLTSVRGWSDRSSLAVTGSHTPQHLWLRKNPRPSFGGAAGLPEGQRLAKVSVPEGSRSQEEQMTRLLQTRPTEPQGPVSSPGPGFSSCQWHCHAQRPLSSLPPGKMAFGSAKASVPCSL